MYPKHQFFAPLPISQFIAFHITYNLATNKIRFDFRTADLLRRTNAFSKFVHERGQICALRQLLSCVNHSPFKTIVCRFSRMESHLLAKIARVDTSQLIFNNILEKRSAMSHDNKLYPRETLARLHYLHEGKTHYSCMFFGQKIRGK